MSMMCHSIYKHEHTVCIQHKLFDHYANVCYDMYRGMVWYIIQRCIAMYKNIAQ